MDNLVSAFRRAVADFGPRTALIDGGGRAISFADLGARAEGYAAGALRAGLLPGDRALIAMPLGADLYAALAGLWQAGVTAVLPEPAMGLPGLRHAVRAASPKALVTAGPYRALPWLVRDLRGLTAIRPQAGSVPKSHHAMALISFTSGSSGAPKAIPRSHDHLLSQFHALQPLLAAGPEARDLIAFPVFALLNLAEGRCSVLPNWRLSAPHRVTGARLDGWIARHGVTRALLPPVLADTLSRCEAPPGLERLFTGGGPVYGDVLARLADRAPGLRVTAVYGSTEAEPIAVLEAKDLTAIDWQSMCEGAGLPAGRRVPQISLRLDDAEIQVSGPHVNRGYLDPAQDRTTKVRDGTVLWHRTGDGGHIDAQNQLWLLGRWRPNRAEADPWPLAVETAARFWPGVRQAALAQTDPGPVLALVGDTKHLAAWRDRAHQQFGLHDVRVIRALPMDRRHRSKIDQAALSRRLGDAPANA